MDVLLPICPALTSFFGRADQTADSSVCMRAGGWEFPHSCVVKKTTKRKYKKKKKERRERGREREREGAPPPPEWKSRTVVL